MNQAAPVSHSVHLPTDVGMAQIAIRIGQPTLILGGNGSGKSALIHRLVTQVASSCVYIPGSRPSYFDNDSLSITPHTRDNLINTLRSWDQNAVTRYRPISGTQRNEKAIYDLQSSEVQFKLNAANRIEVEGSSSSAIHLLQSRSSPLDRANHLLRLSNLPVQLAIYNAQITASRDGHSFSLAKMSDGERAAVIIISEVMSAAPGSVFVIDEPELHLHRSIVVPMIKALIGERPDCAFVISTHELALADEVQNPQVILVRGCVWAGDSADRWVLDVLTDATEIPEDIRINVLGSRRLILFVEGTTASLDRPLYALLFPNTSVQAKSTCKDVRRAVEGLRSVSGLHAVHAYGIIDNDGMSPSEAEQLEAGGIYPLAFYSVESLYYCREVRRAIAVQQRETLGADPEILMAQADAAALRVITPDRVAAFAARVAERRLREAMLNAIPSLESLQSQAEVSTSVPNPFSGEKNKLEQHISAGEIDDVIARYPIRESGALDAIARALRLQGRGDFERAALARIAADATLRESLKAKLGRLAIALS